MLGFRLLLLILHIAAAAVAFGAPLGVGRLLKGAAAISTKAFELAVSDAAKRTFLARLCGVVSMLSGVALIFVRGGFGAVGKNYHTALLLMWILLGIQFFITRPNIKLAQDLVRESVPDTARVQKIAGKLGMAMGIGHALWLTILVLMFQQF